MKKEQSKPQLLKITLTGIWKSATHTRTCSTTMGMTANMSDENIKAMVKEMRDHYKKNLEAESCLYPETKLTVKSKVTSYKVDYILN